MRSRGRITKQLTCPACGAVIADASLQRWAGELTLTSPEGERLYPEAVWLQIKLAEQQLEGAASAGEREHVRARLDYLRRNNSELVFDLRCRNGHSTLRTMPQLARALRRTPGQWVSLG